MDTPDDAGRILPFRLPGDHEGQQLRRRAWRLVDRMDHTLAARWPELEAEVAGMTEGEWSSFVEALTAYHAAVERLWLLEQREREEAAHAAELSARRVN